MGYLRKSGKTPPAPAQSQSRSEKTTPTQGKMDHRSVEWVEIDAKDIPAIDSGTVTTPQQKLAAGRGIVKIHDKDYVEKKMSKWEVLNYARILNSPENNALGEFLPGEVFWQSPHGHRYNLRIEPLPEEERCLLDIASADHKFPVVMTNVSPSGTALDVKLGDLICKQGDSIHEKNSWARSLKRTWHKWKQDNNRAAVTIQTTANKIGRELSELRHDKDFISLLVSKGNFHELEIPKADIKVQQMIEQLQSLRDVVSESNIGYVGCSVLLSLSDEDKTVTLIDLENCILPEDLDYEAGITPKLIETQKTNFITGIDTLLQHLSKLAGYEEIPLPEDKGI